MPLSDLVAVSELSGVNYEKMDEYQIKELFTIESKINGKFPALLITLDHYDIFKIMENEYYVINKTKLIGNGAFGSVYEGIDIVTRKSIVAKYGRIGIHEIDCLKKTGLFIGSYSSNIIFMHKAPGKCYCQILIDRRICGEKKIQIHKRIIDALNQLFEKHGICHNDIGTRHVFVDEDMITFVDFGESYYPFVLTELTRQYPFILNVIKMFGFGSDDIQKLNEDTLFWTTYYNDNKKHVEYIQSLVNEDKKNDNKLIIFFGGILGALMITTTIFGLKIHCDLKTHCGKFI